MGGTGKVSLEKSTGQWYGLPSQGQTGQQTLREAEDTADGLMQILKKAVKQSKQIDQTHISGNERPAQHVGYGSFQATGYGGAETSYNHGKLNYGNQQEEHYNVETTGNLRPAVAGQASVVVQTDTQRPSNSYSGVKGYRHPVFPVQVEYSSETPGLVLVPSSSTMQSEIHEETSVSTSNQEDLPWYKRWGNKIKQTASDLKQKVVG